MRLEGKVGMIATHHRFEHSLSLLEYGALQVKPSGMVK